MLFLSLIDVGKILNTDLCWLKDVLIDGLASKRRHASHSVRIITIRFSIGFLDWFLPAIRCAHSNHMRVLGTFALRSHQVGKSKVSHLAHVIQYRKSELLHSEYPLAISITSDRRSARFSCEMCDALHNNSLENFIKSCHAPAIISSSSRPCSFLVLPSQ